jgi:hypothetical protein
MTLSLADDGTICLEGDTPVEEAEPLLVLLLAHPSAALDLSACNHMHTAIVQVLLAAQRPVGNASRRALINSWLASTMPEF